MVAGALFLAVPARDAATAFRAQIQGRRTGLATSVRADEPRHEGDAVGRLEIPRLGMDVIVFEGGSPATLRRGPGHLPGTAWPAAGATDGNCVIAGHRDSFFRRLQGAREGDLVRFSGPNGEVTYRLESRRVVRPERVEVLAPTPDARLTLVTCYPFGFVGRAPDRLVWTARPVPPFEAAANQHSHR
jgi:sortase A